MSQQLHFRKQLPVILTAVSMLVAAVPIRAQQATPPNQASSGTGIVSIAPSSPPARLLPPFLRGFSARSDAKEFSGDNLRELVGDRAAVYQEYRVVSAASREYAGVRVDVFQTQSQFAAFGLFSFITGTAKGQPAQQELGPGSARVGREVVFWKRNFFVQLGDKAQERSRGRSADIDALARAISDAIVPAGTGATHPPLLDSLPTTSIVRGSEIYFLGPESLSAELEHGRDIFTFEGDTEAVMAEYAQGEAGGAQSLASDQLTARGGSGTPSGSPLKLAIVEYHTPQFATDAMARVTGYLSSLPEDEQQRIIAKRIGNYIVLAVNVRDREFAEALIGSVTYPYTVKWLRNPLWPTNDPFRTQKAAEMLLSTFGLLGLILLTVLGVGTIFGTTIFLKRRKRQQEIFSDAGGMLRLDIDPFESVVLGLPPKRDEGAKG